MNLFPYALLAALAVAGTSLADDLLAAHADADVSGLDPAVDGHHSVDARVFTDAAGAPAAEVLLDGAPVLP